MQEVPLKELFQNSHHSLNQEVATRGFLYKTDSGEVVLAEEPNLRSCCLQGAGKPLLYIIGDVPKDLPLGATGLEGILAYEGRLVLKDAHVVEGALGEALLLFLSVVAVGIILALKLIWAPNFSKGSKE